MVFYWLALGILAVWRVSYLLASESGPWRVFERIRRRAGNGFWGELLSCLYCLSVWVAAPFAFFLGESWKQRLMLWPALSAGAIIVERLVHGSEQRGAAMYIEDEQENDREGDRQDAIRPEEATHDEEDEEADHVLRQK
jgi:hypothetical protein